jgi:hypothetical protein
VYNIIIKDMTMEPIDQYIELIESAKYRDKPEGYVERHHIFPLSFTNKDPEWNKINKKLTG